MLALVSIPACGPDDAAMKRTGEFVGRWTGQYATREEWTYRYLIDRKADGSYELETHRVLGDRVLARETESGKWFIQDGLYKIKIEKIGGRPASLMNTASYQTYSVGDVQGDSIRITHSLSGIQLIERRVALDYKFP